MNMIIGLGVKHTRIYFHFYFYFILFFIFSTVLWQTDGHAPMTKYSLCTSTRNATHVVAGPTTRNLFQNNLREPDMQIDCFRRTRYTEDVFFDEYSAH